MTRRALIIKRGRVPVEPFRTVAMSLIVKHGYDVEPCEGRYRGTPREGVLPLLELAKLMKLPRLQTLYDFRNGGQRSYSFDFCDRLLCALDESLQWFDGELKGLYTELFPKDAPEWAYEGQSIEQQ